MRNYCIEWNKNGYVINREINEYECAALAEDYARSKMGDCDNAIIFEGEYFQYSWTVDP